MPLLLVVKIQSNALISMRTSSTNSPMSTSPSLAVSPSRTSDHFVYKYLPFLIEVRAEGMSQSCAISPLLSFSIAAKETWAQCGRPHIAVLTSLR